jgi:cation diffusion facilitator family transporter
MVEKDKSDEQKAALRK